MKIIRYIYLIFTFSFLFACTHELSDREEGNELETRGMMNVEVTEQQGAAADKMECVRFLIFKEASYSPVLELNERFEVPPVSPGSNEISKFKITLEVSMLLGKENDKIVVVIVNEPASLTAALENVNDYYRLLDMQLDFGDFLDPEHTRLQYNKTMPMAGVVWTNKVYPTEAQAENNPAQMSVWRAPARIDVYLRKESGMDFHLEQGTEITLQNTYDKEYFIRYENETDRFGQIQTVTSGFLNKKWILAGEEVKDLPIVSGNESGRLICSFYTPERTCSAANNSDKLILTLNVITSEGTSRHAEVILDQFITEGTTKQIDMLARNNIYKVIATIGAETITAVVHDWNSEDIITEL